MLRNDVPPAIDRDPDLDLDELPATTSAATEPLVRRRLVLDALEALPEPTTVDRLADELERRSDPALDDDPHAIRVRLHHVDLPRLEDAGLLGYDTDRRRVRLLD